MARPRKSVMAQINEGNPNNRTKEQLEQRLLEERAAVGQTDMIIAPPHLTDDEKAMWEHLAGELKVLNIVGNLDCINLTILVESLTFYNMLTQHMKELTVTDRDFGRLNRQRNELLVSIRAISGKLGLDLQSRMQLVKTDDVPKDTGNANSVLKELGF